MSIKRFMAAFSSGGGASTYSLNAESGSYAVSGVDAALRRRYKGYGSYALSGQDVKAAKGTVIPAGAGAYALAGTAAAFWYGRAIAAGAGSYLISGTPVDFVRVSEEQSVVFEFNKWNPSITRAA